jgi:hypothetical protein
VGVNIDPYGAAMAQRKKLPTSIIIPVDLKEIAQQAARNDRRTLTSLILKALEEHLEREGYLISPEISLKRKKL